MSANQPDMTRPGLRLLSKLASIAVHVVELRSPDGHDFDAAALDGLLADPEVERWLKQMGDAALAPLVRRGASAPSKI